MNLVEQLLRVDKAKFTERKTKKIKSKRLSQVTGQDAEITIQQINGRRFNDIVSKSVDKNGKRDIAKLYDTNLLYCVEGVVEPNLKDPALIEHFGVATPKELASLLFDTESGRIADEIASLSGLTEESEEEVKN